MTAFVVLAAGRGSRLGRIGDELPKALLPLDSKAILSRQFELAPPGARLIVVLGYRADQIEEYVRLAHPDLDVTFVREEHWGRGPGRSLLEARAAVGDDHMVYTACDTLWEPDWELWASDASWLAVAPIPAGTPAARWCRVVPTDIGEFVARIEDKTPNAGPTELAWTAFGCVIKDDLERFWTGLVDADDRAGEIQLSSGIDAILHAGLPIKIKHVSWLDVGDEQAYRTALAAHTGYDPLKPDQITYVNRWGRVVKWHVNPTKIRNRRERGKYLEGAVPELVPPVGTTMCAYNYVEGATLYDVDNTALVDPVLNWWSQNFWATTAQHNERPYMYREHTMRFYRDKTFSRVMSLDLPLQSIALDAITRVDWDDLIEGVIPGTFHGDFTYANIITWDDDWNTKFTTIDWREDFAGVTTWGDLRYDLGKLLSGTAFHWQNATHGDFRRWRNGAAHREAIELYLTEQLEVDLVAIQRIAALCLINSAALHAAPMDEILVTRGARWLLEVL